MKIGDIVTRKSYNKDIIFKIVGFGIDNKNEKIAILKGVAFRVIADAYLEDLEVVKVSDIKQILIDPTVENLIYKSVRSAQDREKKMNRAVPSTTCKIITGREEYARVDSDKMIGPTRIRHVSRSRMGLMYRRAKAFGRHMCVNLRRGKRAMAQELLDTS